MGSGLHLSDLVAVRRRGAHARVGPSKSRAEEGFHDRRVFKLTTSHLMSADLEANAEGLPGHEAGREDLRRWEGTDERSRLSHG